MGIKRHIFILLLAIGQLVAAQTGGTTTYEFLNLSTVARVSASGGMLVSLPSDDPALALCNPALLSSTGSGSISLNYVNYIAGINYGYASAAFHHEKYGTFAGGINYLNYGKIDGADPSGNLTGRVQVSEYSLNLTWSYAIDSLFKSGITIKPVLSQFDRYTSVGAVADAGATYISRDGNFSAGLTLRNIGFQITTYNGVRERPPFEIVAGASLRLAHAPFRFTSTVRHMERYRMIHDNEFTDITGMERYGGISGVTENLLRHMIFSVEFLPSENFFIAGGLNYQRRAELAVDGTRSSAGFSMGGGIRLSGFDLTFSRARYHLAGSSTNISLVLKPALTGLFQ